MLTSQSIDPNERPPHRFFLVRWIVGAWHWVLPPTQAHSDRESDGKRKLRAAVILTLFVGVVAGALTNARPMKHGIDEWRAKGLVDKATKYAEQKDWGSAIRDAQEAVKIAPNFAPGIRLNAQLLTSMGRGEALVYWGVLERQGEASVDDKKGKARALLRVGRPREARELLLELLRDHPDDKDLPSLAEDVMGKQEANTALLDMLKKNAKANPEDRDNALRLAKGQLLTHNAAEESEARKSLWQLSEGEDRVSQEALHIISQLNGLDVSERKRLAAALDAHKLAEGEDHCVALSIRLTFDPEKRNRLIDETTFTWFKGKKGKDLKPLIRWLVLNGEPGRVLTLVNVDDVKTQTADQEILGDYLNALSMLGRFEELSTLVNDERIPLSRGKRTYFKAHLRSSIIFSRPDNLRKLNAGARAYDLLTVEERDDLKQKYLSAVAALVTEGQYDLLLALGEHLSASVKGFYNIAEDAFRAVAGAGNARLERKAVEGWLNSSRRAGNTENLSKAARRGVLRWPDDPKFAEEAFYSDFLQGLRTETSLPRAINLLQASPNDSTRKLIVALGYLRLGDIESAITTCQEIKLTEVNEGQMAVFASIFLTAGPNMVAAGDLNQFRAKLESIVSPIPLNASLFPEEAAMLERARAELARLRANSGQAGR